MKKKYTTTLLFTVFIIFLHIQSALAQEWKLQSIDSVVSCKYPYAAQMTKIDTIVNGIELLQNVGVTDNGSILLMQRLDLKDVAENAKTDELPKTNQELKEFYEEFGRGMLQQIDLSVIDYKFDNIHDLMRYQLVFANDLDEPVFEVQSVLVNTYLYNFIYNGSFNYDATEKETFFNSFKIAEGVAVKQLNKPLSAYAPQNLLKQAKEHWSTILIILLVVLAFIIAMIVARNYEQNKAK